MSRYDYLMFGVMCLSSAGGFWSQTKIMLGLEKRIKSLEVSLGVAREDGREDAQEKRG